jgi:nitroreductase
MLVGSKPQQSKLHLAVSPISKPADTTVAIHPLLQNRWSPRAFDAEYNLGEQDLLALVEAARWAPSSSNGQPWRWSILVRGTAQFGEIVERGLTGSNAAWTPAASALAVLSLRTETDEGKPWGASAEFDGGLSAMQFVLQAEAIGLRAHFMGGIRKDEIAKTLNLDPKLRVMVVIAVGRQASQRVLGDEAAMQRELAPRTRLGLNEVVLHGLPN